MRAVEIIEMVDILEGFKEVENKFIEQGKKKEEVEAIINKFKEARDKNKIKGDERNIDYWGKKDFSEFKGFVNKIEKEKTGTELKKLKKMEGAEKVYEDEEWSVYKITTVEASILYGSGTKWCITTKGNTHFDDYKTLGDFYFYISKTRNEEDPFYKIALLKGEETEQFWDAKDKKYKDLPIELPKINLPEFKEKIEIDGKEYTIKEFENLKELKVGGNLYLINTPITKLPNNLTVSGSLDLYGTKITKLPDNLEVSGWLDLRGIKITELPKDLKVGGNLDLRGTKITKLPDNLKVNGNLYLIGLQIDRKTFIKPIGVKGNVYF